MSAFLLGLTLVWSLGLLGVMASAISPWWLFLFLPLMALNFILEADL